jgi:CheY-like chemotaxis protein
MNVVLGFGQLLEISDLDPDQRENVGHVLKAGRHLLDLIDEVLDLASIEAGRLRLSIEPLPLANVVQETVTLVRPLADARQITLVVPPINRDFVVLADRQRFCQVLLNLLSNAVKYNREQGSVTVICEPDPETPGALRISVADTGLGIAEALQARLFQPFDRLGAESTAVQGTGLGLSLALRLMEAMNGSIGVRSAIGVGSTFWATLPASALVLPEPVPDEPRLLPGQAMGPRRVLAIEDNPGNLALIRRLFADEIETTLLIAMQGSIGLDLAREHRPDVIVLDLHLPDLPGERVLQELQANEQTRAIPVIIASADVTRGQRQRLLDAGAFAFVAKPIDVREFRAHIQRAIGSAQPTSLSPGSD